ncbi:DNA helicase RecQ [Lysinibacillus sp. SGAir0095]|uniref:DNA helicase RecQ n=1 Tax=Lysinibacillus sp. SGAir0095 TaxID=2070463 RepID=UPI0010CCE953|nr:DNA helicase RecQ [Lysinibacillus sp. SGAir0095]QCR32426.1 DNA helicase RecQ [Lysinibacillus sp. SGAir0095]
MIQKAQKVLKQYFGYDSFRIAQQEVIENVLNGRDTLCVMPTGGGKSLCYQVPALCVEGTTVVISPLISLMKDQVDLLHSNGIEAAFINSSLTYSQINETMERVKNGYIKLLYIAPERLENEKFRNELSQLKVPLVAIDEAHCISQWGHDFRPSYRTISSLVSLWSKKPSVIALTATATPTVSEDICSLLRIDENDSFIAGFSRDNLSFKVLIGENREQYIKKYVKNNSNEVGIIYAATRKSVEAVYELLLKNGVRVAKYHGGMGEAERTQEQNRFLQDEVQVMVATNAFGMGINKTNVRFVIHYQMPRNMESYYQEAGRAGRDGLPSECILLYSSSDEQTQRFLIDQAQDRTRIPLELEKLQSMVDYCHTENCLQAYIVEYFGESKASECGQCSNCIDVRPKMDVTEDTQKVLSCVARMGQKFGKTITAQVLAGSRNKKIEGFRHLSTFGILKSMTAKEISSFIEFLISEKVLLVQPGQFPTIYISDEGKAVLLGQKKVLRRTKVEVTAVKQDDPLFEHLRAVRKALAEKEGVPPFVVFSDKTLKDMCEKKPTDERMFLDVSGVGQNKLERYGSVFLSAIKEFSS